MNTQDELVLNHLLSGEPLTSIQAIRMYGITRLAAIVERLEKRDNWRGWFHHINSTVKKNGKKVTFTIYTI